MYKDFNPTAFIYSDYTYIHTYIHTFIPSYIPTSPPQRFFTMSQHQIHLSSTPTPPASLLTLLHSHLPHSLSVLRRLQFANNFSGGSTPHTHVLLARYNDEDESGRDGDGDGDGDGDEEANDGIAFKGEKLQHFTAAYVDLSRAPETQCWVYSSLEDGRAVVGGGDGEEKETEEEAKAMELVMAVMRRIRGIALADNKKEGKAEEGKILVGSLHEAVRQRMLRRGVRMEPSANVPPELGWEFCGKWLFRLEDLPPVERVDKDGDEAGTGLPEWMRWDRVREEDLGLVLSRTSIARQK